MQEHVIGCVIGSQRAVPVHVFLMEVKSPKFLVVEVRVVATAEDPSQEVLL
jgi:hypothetical protein